MKIKKSIQDYTEYLFHCTFTDESFDPEDHEDHLKVSWELFDAYDWANIYPIWKQYLHSHCDTPAKVINFVNLYVYYEAGELFESLSINILTHAKLINMIADPYYSPLKDERILNGIARWRTRCGKTQ
ncbi:MAG: hypothetical protein PUE58_00305 [Lachnospiraceae bacterium]|nr:hypothetical protein [Lachnospiraceae bacterium]